MRCTDDEEHSSHDARHGGLPRAGRTHKHVVGEELGGIFAILGALCKRLATHIYISYRKTVRLVRAPHAHLLKLGQMLLDEIDCMERVQLGENSARVTAFRDHIVSPRIIHPKDMKKICIILYTCNARGAYCVR